MSSLPADITAPGRPEVRPVSAGIYAYVQPDGDLVDQQHGLPGRPAGRHQYRHLRH
jgi:hypothetical protein